MIQRDDDIKWYNKNNALLKISTKIKYWKIKKKETRAAVDWSKSILLKEKRNGAERRGKRPGNGNKGI